MPEPHCDMFGRDMHFLNEVVGVEAGCTKHGVDRQLAKGANGCSGHCHGEVMLGNETSAIFINVKRNAARRLMQLHFYPIASIITSR